ncbi:MAG: hypothetical protein ACYDB7_11020, partial [Mycobacteriales bacterium]
MAVAAGVIAVDVLFLPVRVAPRHIDLLELAAAFFATGSYVANIHIGRQGHAFQLCDVPRLVGLVFASPAALVTGRLLGALPALVLVRRQPVQKVVFNLANFGLEVATAIAVFAALAPRSAGVGLALWPAALAATVAGDLLSSLVVGVVIAIAEGRWVADALLAPVRVALVTSF